MHKSALLDWLWVTNIAVLLYKLWHHSLCMISKLSLQGMMGRMSCHSEYHHQEGWSLSLRLLLSYNLLPFFIPFVCFLFPFLFPSELSYFTEMQMAQWWRHSLLQEIAVWVRVGSQKSNKFPQIFLFLPLVFYFWKK